MSTNRDDPINGVNPTADLPPMTEADAPVHSSVAPDRPEQIGDYRLLRVLGEGGMGVVYEAEQQHPRRPVALKVIRPMLLNDRAVRRFEVEAEILGRLDHSGIARIFEAGTAHTTAGIQPYFAMELVRGKPLRRFADDAKLNLRLRLDLIARICDAIQHAHQRGVVHRDLKPSNVLVGEDGQPKVLDFGVARLTNGDVATATLQTETGQIVGTLPYMSPEQAAGDVRAVDTRADIYALGVIGYELVAGRLPLDLAGKPLPEAVRIIKEEEPSKLSSISRNLRGDVETILGKAMAKEKERRYASAGDMGADIRRFLNYEPIAARRPGTWYQVGKFTRRNKTLVGGVVATFVVLVIGLIGTTIQAYRATRAEQATAAQQVQTNAQRVRADREAANARREAANQYVREAAVLWERGDHATAMLALTRALELDSEDPERVWADRIRLGSTSRRTPRILTSLPSTLPGTEWSGGNRVLEMPDTSTAEAARQGVRVVDRFGERAARVLDHDGRDGNVTCASFSPDGQWVATGSRDGRARIFDAATGALLTDPVNHGSDVEQIAFSGDGRFLATRCDSKSVALLLLPQGEVFRLLTHPVKVDDMAISPDGNRLVTLVEDETRKRKLRLWNCNSGKLIVGPLDSDEYTGLRFSPDGSSFALFSNDCVRIRSAGEGMPTVTAIKVRSPQSLAFSMDGRRLAVASEDMTIRVFNARTGDIEFPPVSTPWQIEDLSLSSDGTMVYCRPTRGRVHGWLLQLQNGMARLPHPAEVIEAVHFLPDNSLVTFLPDGNLRKWKAPFVAPAALKRMTSREEAASVKLDVSTDGTRLLFTHWTNAKLLDTAKFDVVGRALKHPHWVQAARLRPDGTRVVTSAHDHCLRTWNTADGSAVRTFQEAAAPATRTSDSTDEAFSMFGFVPTIDPVTGEVRLAAPDRTEVAISPDAERVAVCNKDGIRFWSAATGRIEGQVKTGAMSESPTFSGDGRRLAVERRGVRFVYEAPSGQPVGRPIEHAGHAGVVQLNYSGDKVLTTGSDNTARVWDVITGVPLTTPMKHSDRIAHATFSPDGKMVVTAGKDGTVALWDAATGMPLAPVMMNQSGRNAQFNRDGKYLVTTEVWVGGKEESYAVLWDLSVDLRPLLELRLEAEVLACQRHDPTGSMVRLTTEEWDRRLIELAAIRVASGSDHNGSKP